MKTDTAEKILSYVREKKQVTANELVGYLSISPQAVFKQLRKLILKNELTKTGKPPSVYYSLALKEKPEAETQIDPRFSKVVEENFMTVSPAGESLEGIKGFVYWCKKFSLPVNKTAGEYEKILRKYDDYKTKGLIDGMEKFIRTFSTVNLDKIFYLDFYAIERFGKTKLGQCLLYAKQGQNRKQIRLLTDAVKPQIENIVKEHKIDGIGFIPPTIKRDVQFMNEMRRNLKIPQRIISIIKIRSSVIVAQKTLNKLEDRIENAKNSIIINDEGTYQNVLLIDDAIGSGATLNETAGQIKNKKLCKGKIMGLSITGSFKGFDVISEI